MFDDNYNPTLFNQYFARFASDSSVQLAAKTFGDIERAAYNYCVKSGVTWDEVKILNCNKKLVTTFNYIRKDQLTNNQIEWKEK